jgi:hypothetical protein
MGRTGIALTDFRVGKIMSGGDALTVRRLGHVMYLSRRSHGRVANAATRAGQCEGDDVSSGHGHRLGE